MTRNTDQGMPRASHSAAMAAVSMSSDTTPRARRPAISSRSVIKVSVVHMVPPACPPPAARGGTRPPVAPFTTTSGRTRVPIGRLVLDRAGDAHDHDPVDSARRRAGGWCRAVANSVPIPVTMADHRCVAQGDPTCAVVAAHRGLARGRACGSGARAPWAWRR